MKYLKLVDGLKSNANGFEYKIGEVNVAETWNPETFDPVLMGGFSFSTDTKILRWIHRGDTIYDVKVPKGAQLIDCPSPNCPHGVFRSNKIIITNPRKVTEDMVMKFYKKSDLPEKTYYQCIVVLLYRHYINVAKQIIKDKVNKDNINDCINEFERFVTDKHDGIDHIFHYDDLWPEAKEIYDILLGIQKGIDF
jgi:hypothetical protein